MARDATALRTREGDRLLQIQDAQPQSGRSRIGRDPSAGERINTERCTISRKVFVGNLSFDVTRDDLLQVFGSVGSVSDVILPLDRATGRPRGFAFVEFASDADADAAIQTVNGKELRGRPINVSEARERVPRLRPDAGESGPFGLRNRPFKTKGSRRGIRGRKRSL